MNTSKIDKVTIIKSVAKMVSDNEAVRLYLKGKTSLMSLIEKGIKLAKPIWDSSDETSSTYQLTTKNFIVYRIAFVVVFVETGNLEK